MSAVLAALFETHDEAQGVRTSLVSDGFPTDRVELTSRQEPGRAGVVPADSLPDKLQAYFSQLFDRDDERQCVQLFVAHVHSGDAALVIHPRGDIEITRALEILEAASPIEVRAHGLEDQALEQAASPSESTVLEHLSGRN